MLVPYNYSRPYYLKLVHISCLSFHKTKNIKKLSLDFTSFSPSQGLGSFGFPLLPCSFSPNQQPHLSHIIYLPYTFKPQWHTGSPLNCFYWPPCSPCPLSIAFHTSSHRPPVFSSLLTRSSVTWRLFDERLLHWGSVIGWRDPEWRREGRES